MWNAPSLAVLRQGQPQLPSSCCRPALADVLQTHGKQLFYSPFPHQTSSPESLLAPTLTLPSYTCCYLVWLCSWFTPLLPTSEAWYFESNVAKPPPVSATQSAKPFCGSKFRLPARPGLGELWALPGVLQKGVFIQLDCCYYVAKHSIKIVIYETCVALVVFSFSFFFFFLFFCFVIYQGEKSQA